MPTIDPRVDAFIAKAQPFAQPILRHVRAVIHEACPDVVETIKWGMPSFEYHGILAGMAAFKAHAAFGFWKGELVTGPTGEASNAMWGFGRLTSVKDLPSKPTLRRYVRKAMRLNEAGTKAPPRPRKHPPKAVSVRAPADLTAAINRSARAKRTWASLSPSAKRDYAEWILDAKQAATRVRRVATSVEWLAEGKRRNWKYESPAKKK